MKHRTNHRKQSDYCHQTGKKRLRDPREATARLQSLLNQAHRLEAQRMAHSIRVVRKYRCDACHGRHLPTWENYGASQQTTPSTPAIPAQRDPLMISLAKSLKPAPTAKKGTLRTQDICDRYAAGETLEHIGHIYGVTRERVRQVIMSVGGPTAAEVRQIRAERQAKQDALDAARLRKLMHQHPGRTAPRWPRCRVSRSTASATLSARMSVSWTCPLPHGSPRGPRRAQPAFRGLLPNPDLDRGLTQRLRQLHRLGLKLLPRDNGPDFPAASAVFPASRNSAFHRPIDCSDTFSRRAASAIDICPASTLNTIRVFSQQESMGSSHDHDSPSGLTQLSCHKV